MKTCSKYKNVEGMVTTCLITNKFKQQTKRHDTSFIILFMHKEYTMNVQQKVQSACPRNYLEISTKTHTSVSTKWHQANLLLDQYSETNVMHLLFSLLRIKGLYMFQALLAHLQEALHKWHLVYCMRVMSLGCTRTEVELHSHHVGFTILIYYDARSIKH
jgi:hypothetical protein